MQQYLAYENVKKAAGLSIVITVMSAPRIMEAGLPLWLYLPTAFLVMTLTGGMVTAWGGTAGMCGFLPAPRRMWIGTVIALAVAIVLTPIFTVVIDPSLKEALSASDDQFRVRMQFPDSVSAAFALMLWVASFQVMFFHAGAMSLFCRLTHRRSVALMLVIALGVTVRFYQFGQMGLVPPSPALLIVNGAAISMTSCLLFAYCGLPPVMVLAAALESRHLFSTW